MTTEDIFYTDDEINFLEAVWGKGYLSPGGPAEVVRLLNGIDIQGKHGVDIGCGSGGITVSLVREFGAASVIGIDVEPLVCATALAAVSAAGLTSQINIRQIDPGALPLADESLDFVFSKDSIVHIPDKEFLAADAFRVLKPGGWFVASDWLISHDGEPSAEMAAYIAAEDLGFGMASPIRYQNALSAAGFIDVELRNRNAWYHQTAQQEVATMEGDRYEEIAAIVGKQFLDEQIALWHQMIGVLATGEHCPHHFRARKPPS